MRTTLTIDDDVLDDVKRIAQADGRPIGAVATRLLRQALAPVSITYTKNGFPVFDVPENGAKFDSDDVARALDAE